MDAELGLQHLDDTAYAKRWLKRRREERWQMAVDDDFPFDLPFERVGISSAASNPFWRLLAGSNASHGDYLCGAR